MTEIAFDVSIYEDEEIWEGVATAPTAIGEDVDKILEPVEDLEMAARCCARVRDHRRERVGGDDSTSENLSTA